MYVCVSVCVLQPRQSKTFWESTVSDPRCLWNRRHRKRVGEVLDYTGYHKQMWEPVGRGWGGR